MISISREHHLLRVGSGLAVTSSLTCLKGLDIDIAPVGSTSGHTHCTPARVQKQWQPQRN
eukprot:scaffold223086_cov17-Tisochrysis_lutea.AAC.1